MWLIPVTLTESFSHEKAETTLNTYVHLYPNKQNKFADKLDAENSVEVY